MRHDKDAERKLIWGSSRRLSVTGLMLCRIVWMSRLSFGVPAVISLEAKEGTSVIEHLVDIRYVCASCGMKTKRTVAEEA